MTRPRLARLAGGILLGASLFQSVTADDSKTVGRVRVTTVPSPKNGSTELVSASLEARFAPVAGKRFADQRVISVRPRPYDPTRFDATIYDYAVERAFELVLDAKGKELSRAVIDEQPARPLDELADAQAIVRESAAFGPAIESGAITLYEAMPPVTVGANGRRLVNVGVISRAPAGANLDKNEIVSVHIPSGDIVRYPTGAPETARAALLACGPPGSGCGAVTGPCSYYKVVWPAADPVWTLNVRHPSCTTSVQAQGTGLELTDVYYQGRLILKRAEVPVLNVQYVNNTCGPYRDWLYSEDCFQANGTDVPSAGSGIRVASAPPSTLCESGTPGSDAGNFKGVALFDEGDALWIMTETNAGWYRYIMEWRLHLDGTIEPIFGFGAISNSCTCNDHRHHAYWRMEWAVDAASDGTIDDPATGVCTLEHRRLGTLDEYDPVTTEGTFIRPVSGGDQDLWRIKNPVTGNGYVLEPGLLDGNANGDSYGKWDFAALALNAGQIDDPNTSTSINITPWINGEPLGATKRLVTWYHATYDHDDPNGTGEPCELSGPKLVPLVPCAGSLTLDRSAYTCGSSVAIVLNDRDLAGAGTASVGVSSASEPTPEPLALTETPPGSGRFQGAITIALGAPVGGDGKVSVADGETISVDYLDASSCGAPNVPVSKTALVDCSAPVIVDVHAEPAADRATIDWNTNEPTNGIVHFGTSIPTPSSTTTTGTSLTHTVTLAGLAECTTYYFWLESADAGGNVAASNSGGGYFAFTTAQSHGASFSSTGAPIPIPDNSSIGATSTLSVADPFTVEDVNVTVNVTHTYTGDLTLSLITPSNATITLAARRGGSGNNYTNTTFDDEATTPITAGAPPFTGSFTPETPLSAADGIPGAGAWKLKVVDSATIDTGTFDSWTLELTYPSTACSSGAPPPVPDGSFGTGMTVAPSTGAAPGLHLTWDTATCAATNNHLVFGSLGDVSTFALDGAVCGLGPTGSYDWTGVPGGDLWFLVVGDDASATEGSWGTDGTGADRNGGLASGYCGFTARNNAGSCP